MKIIVTPNVDPPYNLITTYPAYNDGARPPDLTDDEVLQRVLDKLKVIGAILEDAPVYIIDDSELPDDYFFNAFEWED